MGRARAHQPPNGTPTVRARMPRPTNFHHSIHGSPLATSCTPVSSCCQRRGSRSPQTSREYQPGNIAMAGVYYIQMPSEKPPMELEPLDPRCMYQARRLIRQCICNTDSERAQEERGMEGGRERGKGRGGIPRLVYVSSFRAQLWFGYD